MCLTVWTAVAAVRPFIPTLPASGLDPSWTAVMGEVADRHWRMGVDLVFPYGPAASVVTHYLDGTYFALTLPLLLVTCTVFGFGTLLALQGRAPRSRLGPAALVALVATLGLVLPATADFPDAFYLVLPWVPVLLIVGGAAGSRSAKVVAAVAAALIGGLGLAKASFPVAALPLFLMVDAATLARRRLPVLTLPFVIGFLVGDIAYGQALADLPAYLGSQFDVVAGYADAMALDGSRLELLAFCGCAALLLILTILAEWRGDADSDRSRVVLPLALGVTAWTLLKAGFIRQDLHTIIGWSGLALLACLLAWGRLRLWRWDAAAAVLVCAVAGAAVLIPWTISRGVAPPRSLSATIKLDRYRLIRDPEVQFIAAWEAASDPQAFAARMQDDKNEHWQRIADRLPLPMLAGRVDTIPSIQSRVIANGLDYRPRPNFQEYSTFNAALLEANRVFLTEPEAPDWMLFGREPEFGTLTLDHRYPNFAEGALWLDLLRLYRPACTTGEIVALQRRAIAAELHLGDVLHTAVRFDEAVTPAAGAVVSARIVVHPTLLGRLAALLFRPVPVVMEVGFADGHRQAFQFITGIAEAGFVLSPLVTDAAEFVALSEGRQPPSDRAVTSFSIHAPPRLHGFFTPVVDVALQTLTLPAADAAAEPLPPCGSAP